LGLLHHHKGVAGKEGHDRCSHLYVGGSSGGGCESGYAIHPGPACGHPNGVDSCTFGVSGGSLNVRDITAADGQADGFSFHL
jgi:hypothetical protein